MAAHDDDIDRLYQLPAEEFTAARNELAKRLGKPQSFVAKYEGGERRLDVVEFLGVMRAIGGDPIRLVKALLRDMG